MTTSPSGASHSEPTFARNLGLFDATMIGVGAMIVGGQILQGYNMWMTARGAAGAETSTGAEPQKAAG